MLVSLLIGAGIFLGERFGKKSSDVTPTPISPQTALPTQSPSPTVVPTQSHTIIEAGGIAPFVAYTLSANPSWTAKKEHTDTMDKLTLTQGDYHLVILQAAI